MANFDNLEKLRKDFPILKEKINNHPIIYFDNAATSQRPMQVLDALMNFYTKYNSNIHRGVHAFGEIATTLYEDARKKIAEFIGANHEEVIFTQGTTESINFIASTWADKFISRGDEIVITQMEHHSNLVPWQQVVLRKNAKLKYIPIDKEGKLEYDKLPDIITKKTKLVAVTYASNVLGTYVDVEKIIKASKQVGAKTLIDAAQAAPHRKIDVKKLECDFMAFSGHKMLGPTGIGVLFMKKEIQQEP